MSTLSNIEFDYVSTEEIPKALTIEQEGMQNVSSLSQKFTRLSVKDILLDEAGTENTFRYFFSLLS
jgi:hypothetical protein